MNPELLQHWFWLLLTIAALTWYSTITIYVAVHGASDIRGMLARLKQSPTEKTSDPLET